MPDLKAAAERLRSQVSEYRDNYYLNDDQNADNRSRHESLMRSFVLAAQALEALAWQAEVGAKVKQCWTGERWFCEVADGEYVADDPLGALLAAMEGEKDGN
jgi:uncharacterized iron-regulated membrane protein